MTALPMTPSLTTVDRVQSATWRLVRSGSLALAALAPLPDCVAHAAPQSAPHAAPRTETQRQAEALFSSGQQALDAGRVEDACRDFAASQALDPAVGTQYNLARCFELQGRNAEAYRLYVEVANTTQAVGQSERATAARRRAEEAWAKLGQVELQIPAELAQQYPQIALDGRVLSQGEAEGKIPLDPGPHKLRLTAPRFEPYEVMFEVEAAGAVAAVLLPVLTPARRTQKVNSGLGPRVVAPAPVAPSAPVVVYGPAVGSAGAETGPLAPPSNEATPRTGFFASPWNVAGLGLGALAVGGAVTGTVYALGAVEQKDLSRPFCDGAVCEPQGAGYYRSAQRQAGYATLAFVVAGVAAPLAVFGFWRGAQSRPELAVVPNGLLVRSRW